MSENFEKRISRQPDQSINPALTEGALGRDLEDLGIVSTQKRVESSRNDTFEGVDSNGKRFFIKKYTEMPTRGQRVIGPGRRTEIECYEHLSDQLPLPRFVRGNQEEEYLIVEYVDLHPLAENEEDIGKAVDLIDSKLGQTSAPFLPGMEDDYYDRRLPAKVDELVEKGFLDVQQADRAKAILQEQREVIREAPVAFSHEDLIRENIKKDAHGKIIIIDPEFARQDVVELDAASFLIDLSDNPELEQLARERFRENGILNMALLRAMEVRRCVDMCRALARRGEKGISLDKFPRHLNKLKQITG